jgi:FAD/FMN-containing dehydrogenase
LPGTAGSISAEQGIGALKASWLPLARTDAERALFARIRAALDPSATLNPKVLPHLSVAGHLWLAGGIRGPGR